MFDRSLAIFSLLVTVCGFWLAIAQIRKTKRAADAAKESADHAKSRMLALDALAHYQESIDTLIESQVHLQQKLWSTLPKKLTQAKQAIIKAKHFDSNLTNEMKSHLQIISSQLTIAIDTIQKAISLAREPSNIKLSKIINDCIDKLTEIQAISKVNGEAHAAN